MTDKAAVAQEQDTPPQEQEADPFEGIQSEAYDRGERVEDAPEEPKAPVPVREAMGEGDDAGEESEEASARDDEGAEEDEHGSKPKRTAQERINELTRLRREAEREAEALRAQLQALNQEKEPPVEEEEAPKEAPESEGPPNPKDFDYGELDPRYISALVDYQTEQKLSRYRQEQQEVQRVTEMRSKFQEKVTEGSKKHEDFYEKVVVGAEKNQWALSPVLGEMLVDSDVGDDIAYHLASHPDEALEVYRQSPVDQARYFGKMEAKFSASRTAAVGNDVKSERKPPKAPPPVQPARGADGKFLPSADSDDFAAFERRARQEI